MAKLDSQVIEELRATYASGGYMRVPNPERQKNEGPTKYKKGLEVRFVVRSRSELALIRRLLSQAGFRPGRPFQKGNRFLQPLYGYEAVSRFISLVQTVHRD